MINLEWIRTFTSIYECATITEASKKLNMTQPGVSKHLSALENHVGKKLFDRTTRKVIPTEYGKFFYAQIITPIKALEKVEHYSSQRIKKQRLSIVIGCTQDFFRKELVHKIYGFDMYIVTRFGSDLELIEGLNNDEIQLLIGVKNYEEDNHVLSFLEAENLVLVTSKDLEIPQDLKDDQTKLNKWLLKQNWFVNDNNLHDVKAFWQANFNSSPKLVPRYILPSYTDILEVLVNNNGVAVLPDYVCQNAINQGLVHIPFPSLKTVEQKLFFSNKLKNENAEALMVFKKKLIE